VYLIIRGHIANVFHVFNTYKHEDMRLPRLAQRKQVWLGILFSALRYVAVLKITEKIYSNTLIFSSFFNDFILLILSGSFLKF